MAITYPLSLPTNIGIANITFSAENAVGVSQSPFTYQQQVIQHQGQRWKASVTLPPMKRVDSENWLAFLLSLKGQVGTFLLGDPNAKTAQGKATPKRNLLSYTEKFDNAAWTKTRISVVANSVTDPNNNLLADTLVEDTSTNNHIMTRMISFTVGTAYVLSIYVKLKDNTRNLRLAFPTALFGSTSAAFFNPAAGTIVSTSAGTTSYIEPAGNGWYRVSISKVCAVSGTDNITVSLTQGTTLSYTGDGVSGHYIWGAQLETGMVMTAYQGVEISYGPFVNGVNQLGGSLIINGCSPSVTGFFLPGDYIQLGAGATARLHKVLTQVNTDDSGNATLDIWPNLVTAPVDGSDVVVQNTVGRFRLASNLQQWQIDNISSYGISFDCVEAL